MVTAVVVAAASAADLAVARKGAAYDLVFRKGVIASRSATRAHLWGRSKSSTGPDFVAKVCDALGNHGNLGSSTSSSTGGVTGWGRSRMMPRLS